MKESMKNRKTRYALLSPRGAILNIISAAMAFCIFWSHTVPASAEQSFGAFRFEKFEKSVLITGFNSVFSDTIVIPSSINSVPVTRINDVPLPHLNSGEWHDVLYITFPETIEYIGSLVGASFPSLSELHLPSSVKKIGERAFYKTSLSEVTLPEGLTEIGSFAFAKTNIKKITVPKTVQKFDNSILYGCQGATVEIAADNKFFKTTRDGIYSASGDTLIKYLGRAENVTLPDTVKYIGSFAFMGSNVKTIKTSATPDEYAFADSKIKNAVLSGGGELPSYAFSGCSELSAVSLGKDFTKVCAYAFKGCPKNFTLEISGNLYNIDKEALDTSFLGTIKAPLSSAGEAYATLFEGAAFAAGSAPAEAGIPVAIYREADGKTNIERYIGGAADAVIPSVIGGKSVGEVEAWSFSGTDIKSIKIYSQALKIGLGAFCGARLEKLAFVGTMGLIDIGERAFEGCPLSVAELDSAVKTIGERAFSKTLISEITIPKTTTHIGSRAFADCPNLKRIYFEGDMPYIAEDAFEGCSDIKFYYKNESDGFENAPLPTERVPSLSYNGNLINLETPSINIGGTVMVPIKEFFAFFGYTASWRGADGESGSVVLRRGDNTIKIYMNSTKALFGSTEKTLCAAGTVLDGMSRLPARAAAELLGFKVIWHGEHNIVLFAD